MDVPGCTKKRTNKKVTPLQGVTSSMILVGNLEYLHVRRYIDSVGAPVTVLRVIPWHLEANFKAHRPGPHTHLTNSHNV